LALRKRLFIPVAALAALAVPAHAGELVSLRNGFALHCDHHAEIDGHVRLYLNAGDDNYIEFPPQEVAGVEPAADLPPAPPDAAIAASPDPAASTTSAAIQATQQQRNAVLSPAVLSPQDLREMLAQAGTAHHLDVDLLASLVKAESNGNVRAVSRTGARGLMQLMPGTAAELGVQDSFRPDENVRGGSAYLDALLVRYRDNLALALAAYNAGPAAVDKYRGIPPYHETRAYVARVIHEFNRRVLAREALAHQAISAPPLQENRASR
jgi:soluble lytic murein transglycosylase-like protein